MVSNLDIRSDVDSTDAVLAQTDAVLALAQSETPLAHSSEDEARRQAEEFGGCGSGSTDFYSDLADDQVLPTLTTADTRARALHRLKRDLSFLNAKRTRCEQFQAFMYNTFGTESGVHRSHWIRTPAANSAVGLLILVNAAFIGIETDCAGPEAEGLDSNTAFAIETTFLVFFILELLFRFKADRCQMFKDYWNVFDAALVLLGAVDTWILWALFPQSEDRSSDLHTFTLFRLGRLLRIARVLRVLRLLRFVRELLLLVKGLLGALKALIWAFLLIMMVLYLAAVFATELLHPEEEDPQLDMWFGSVGASILSLSQLMTLEGWPQIVRYTAMESGKIYLLLFFLSFLCCTNFALLNVVTAVMVEKVFEFAQDEKMQEAKRAHKDRAHSIKKIERLFVSVDKDASGSITTKELKEGVINSEVTKQFQELGIAKHDVDTLFQCLDVDGNGELSIAEFIEGCLRMHGSATSKDLLRIQYDVHRTRKSLDIKKLTRHMTWSALCLHKDFNNSKNARKLTKRDRKRRRAKTAGADGGNIFSGKASEASAETLPALTNEALARPIPAMLGMQAPPGPAEPREKSPLELSKFGTDTNRPPPLPLPEQGQGLNRVRPAPLQIEPSNLPDQRSISLGPSAATSPSGRRRASIGHSPLGASNQMDRRRSDGIIGSPLNLSPLGPSRTPTYRRTSLRARTVPSRIPHLSRSHTRESDLTSSVSNETSGSSAAHISTAHMQSSKETSVAAPGSDVLDLSLPPEGHRLLEEVQADQRHMAQLLMTLGEEVKQLKRLSKQPGAVLDGSWTLKEEEHHVQLRVAVMTAQGLRNADTLIGQGVSDPYCVCRLRGKPQSEWKTRVISDNLDPVWNEAQTMADFAVGDQLEFEVMDKDLFKQDDMLGWATMACSEFYPHGFKGVLPLIDRGGETGTESEAELTVHIQVLEKEEQTKEGRQEDVCDDPLRTDSRTSTLSHFQTTPSMPQRIAQSSFAIAHNNLSWLKRSLTGDLGEHSQQEERKDKSRFSILKRRATGNV